MNQTKSRFVSKCLLTISLLGAINAHAFQVTLGISFDMPIRDIAAYLRQTDQQPALVVAKGLPKGKTITDFYQDILPKLRNQGLTNQQLSQLKIDPRFFQKHDIKSVPFFEVLINDETYTLAGTVSIDYAINLATEKHQQTTND